MKKSDLFPALADINFAVKDPDTISREIINAFESASGRTLSQADPVRLFLDVITLIIIQQRNIIDIAAKNNLIAYAEGQYLDHIGALFGVTRLGASHAYVTAKFSLSAPLSYPVTIPKGTRITADGKITFSTQAHVTIPAGVSEIEAVLTCDSSGTSGNNFCRDKLIKSSTISPSHSAQLTLLRLMVALTRSPTRHSANAFTLRPSTIQPQGLSKPTSFTQNQHMKILLTLESLLLLRLSPDMSTFTR